MISIVSIFILLLNIYSLILHIFVIDFFHILLEYLHQHYDNGVVTINNNHYILIIISMDQILTVIGLIFVIFNGQLE